MSCGQVRDIQRRHRHEKKNRGESVGMPRHSSMRFATVRGSAPTATVSPRLPICISCVVANIYTGTCVLQSCSTTGNQFRLRRMSRHMLPRAPLPKL